MPASYTHATQAGIASALYITITLGCPRRPIRLNIMTFREPNRQIDHSRTDRLKALFDGSQEQSADGEREIKLMSWG
jgi:hypothetical protein